MAGTGLRRSGGDGIGAGEVRHGGVTGGADAVAPDHLCQGAPENAQIEQEAVMIDVPRIQAESLFPADGVAAVDLGPAGDAGLDQMPSSLLGRITRQVFHKQGAGTDQAHLSLEDIEDFRQLVQAGAAQKAAEGGQPHRVGERFPLFVAGVGHGAEFEHQEGASVQPRALLTEEDGAPQPPGDEQGDNRHQGGEEQRGGRARGQIQQPLHLGAS